MNPVPLAFSLTLASIAHVRCDRALNGRARRGWLLCKLASEARWRAIRLRRGDAIDPRGTTMIRALPTPSPARLSSQTSEAIR